MNGVEKGGREADESKRRAWTHVVDEKRNLCAPLFPQVRNTRDTRARLSPLRGGNLPPRVPSCLSIRPLFPSHCSWSILDTQSPAIEKITAAEILVFAGCSSFFTFEQLRAHNVQPAFSLPSLGVCSPSVTVVRAQTERDRDHRLSLPFFFSPLHDSVVRCSTFQTRTTRFVRIFFAF